MKWKIKSCLEKHKKEVSCPEAQEEVSRPKAQEESVKTV